MTTAVSPLTLVAQQAALLREINEVLERHPVAGAFRLLYAPETLEVSHDTVFVQVVDAERGVVELHPRHLFEIASGDVLHATQTFDLGDDALSDYASEARASDCKSSNRLNGSRGHIYVI
ncbi:hypothetical protein [Streptomyces prunicolor]|uniref:hypothetical protein n=1 Tax=Streptomyces prunicolor TaxID=67348 RepID=UPI000374A0B2|nr:hypothetical protein [Streptomyces prunicolor]